MAETKDSEKKHVSVVICGHVDAGKSTTTGRLIFDLGGISERDMEKLKEEATLMGKASFAFAFYMDRHKEERERGVTIACTTKEFYTEKYHYTIIDAPGHRDFIKNMISGASQADIALLMIPADGNFEASIAKGNHKSGEIQGQSRQHCRLLNLIGVNQIAVGVNKMDVPKYKKEKFEEIRDEAKNILKKCGWKNVKNIPIIPLSGYQGDNILKTSENMKWWKGVDVEVNKKKVHVETLLHVLNDYVVIPKRDLKKVMRMPVSGVYKIKGVGDVITGRVEQGLVKTGDEVVFIPTHTKSTACAGKVFSIEMHHKTHPDAGPGDNVGLNIKGLLKVNMPKVGDIMCRKSEPCSPAKDFIVTVKIMPQFVGEAKVGYAPIGFVRTARSAMKIEKIVWKMSKTTGGAKVSDAKTVKRNDMCQLLCSPQQKIVVTDYKECAGLGRIAFMEGNGLVMMGKISKVTPLEDK